MLDSLCDTGVIAIQAEPADGFALPTDFISQIVTSVAKTSPMMVSVTVTLKLEQGRHRAAPEAPDAFE